MTHQIEKAWGILSSDGFWQFGWKYGKPKWLDIPIYPYESRLNAEVKAREIGSDTVEILCNQDAFAAGPWLEGPAPDGKINGEMMLFQYPSPTTYLGVWRENQWVVIGGTFSLGGGKEYLYAHVNQQPVNEGGCSTDGTL